jgi:D-xylose 1-dehydrogenase (NADP+, D-xylono-1,5-lactone-forming)
MSAPSSTPLRMGVLGAANIARQFIAAVASSTALTVAAVASRDEAKAAAFAKETGVPRSYGTYEALLADPEIDAVYIPLPNDLHCEWAVRAAEAGKHILCEKPLAVNAAEARVMFEAAKKAGVHLVEAYPYMSQPQTLKMRELIAGGAIGQVQIVRSSFSFKIPKGPNIRLNPGPGGGALFDAGSYAISLVRLAVGERPSRVVATSQFDENGVDLTTVAMLEFPSGVLAQISCSFATAFHRHASIAGDDGLIETTYLNHPPVGGAPVVSLRRGIVSGTPFETIEVEPGNGFFYEAESFARLVAGDPAGWNGATEAESMDILLTIDAAWESIRSGEWIDVESEA